MVAYPDSLDNRLGLEMDNDTDRRLLLGVDFSLCEAHWSYSGFHAFRTRLAKEAGIDLDRMKGFAAENPPVSWDTVDDDIKILLDHSDCDGEMSPKDCRLVVPRLKELIEPWPDEDYDKIHAQMLGEGMDLAVMDDADLLFR